MRIFFNLISICIILAVLFFIKLNSNINLEVLLLNPKSLNTFTLQTSFAYIVLAIFILGSGAGIIFSCAFFMPIQKRFKEYQKKLEKTTIQADTETSKIGILEAKIKTLEKALDSALDKNN